MPRQIKSPKTAAVLSLTSTTNQADNYLERLLKLIPSEIVTAYIFFSGMITAQKDNQKLLIEILIIGMLILIPFYLKKFNHVDQPVQIIFTMIGFLIWTITLGSFTVIFPSVTIFENTVFRSLILFFYTALIPVIYKG